MIAASSGTRPCTRWRRSAARWRDHHHRRARRQERGVGREHLARQPTQGRQIVQDPDAAAVGRDQQVVLARVDGDVAHGDRRELALDGGPLRAAVDRDEEPGLGAQEQQLRLHQVLAHHVRVTREVGRRQALPGLPEVRRPVDVGLHVAGPVTVEGGERRPFVEASRLDAGDPGRGGTPGIFFPRWSTISRRRA